MPECERLPRDRSASGDASLLEFSNNISYFSRSPVMMSAMSFSFTSSLV
jgi:hypothetical protein